MELIGKNPHCSQAFSAQIRPHIEPIVIKDIASLNEILSDECAQLPYFDRDENERSSAHFGQLKLFVSELQFLTRFTRVSNTLIGGAAAADSPTPFIPHGLIVYAGAAGGHHIERLVDLFPTFKFHLYDSSRFCRKILSLPTDRCETYFKYFTNDDARSYSEEENVIFISDIRTGLKDECVKTDMEYQKEWIQIMRPVVSMVKFRLPWDESVTEYFDGDIQIQAYAPCTSTETRLIITDVDSVKLYNNSVYEQQMCYHNCVGRVSMYDHRIRGVQGLDQCFDCALLIKSVYQYLDIPLCDISDPTLKAVSEFINVTIKSFDLKKNINSSVRRSTTRGNRAAAHIGNQAAAYGAAAH